MGVLDPVASPHSDLCSPCGLWKSERSQKNKKTLVCKTPGAPRALICTVLILCSVSWQGSQAEIPAVAGEGDWDIESSGSVLRHSQRSAGHELQRRETEQNNNLRQGKEGTIFGANRGMEREKKTNASCESLLRLSQQYMLAKAFRKTLALDLLPPLSCEEWLSAHHNPVNPLKRAPLADKPWLFQQALLFLREGGRRTSAQQAEVFPALQKQLIQSPYKPSLRPIFKNDDRCPDKNPYLLSWRPGHDGSRKVVIGAGLFLKLESSATVHSIVIEGGGVLVFADNPEDSIILRTRYILIRDGGVLHIGSEKCPYNGSATISLYGMSTEGLTVENFGGKFIGVDKGGTLEMHGKKPLSWTLLARTLHPMGLQHGPYQFERYWGSRGINVRVVDDGTGQVLSSERFDTHMMANESRRLKEFLSNQPAGVILAMAVGDSAAKSLSLEAREYILEVLGSKFIKHLGYRQPWALVGTLRGGPFSTTENRRPYTMSGTTGAAIARREFQTYDGTRFTVTAYSEWVKGSPHIGFKVEALKGIVVDLVDDVTSWVPGDRIVIASTDYSMHQAEEFSLLPCPECKTNQVKIDGKPRYLHMGEIVDGIDMRAEVGLLSRNIIVKSEMESSCYGENHCDIFNYDTFGGHIKIQKGFRSFHLSGVELTAMGQQNLGSYPVHFHLAGDVDQRGGYHPPTSLENLSIHHGFSRCVTVHATHGLLVKDVVAYDTLGHCFFLEDGVEERNTFYHNLGLLTKPGTILPTDRDEPMCLRIRKNVFGNYRPVPSTDCMAVSTFWIANPNNNLINNAAAGAQDVGIWYIFHRVPTGLSEGLYPEGKTELTPLGIFYNNRVHSNFKAGLFIGKGVKTSNASAANPREYLTIDNARYRPHQDADPAKPRVPAVIDGLVAFKNNDHGAWARGGDITFQNCGFADNGIGLTLASDGTFPTDEGSSLEVTKSIFVGESSNVGSHGGQNSYWGEGANGEYRTLPRNKTFPIRGFQIYDGPVRLTECSFKKFTPTADRYSSALGFFMKNAWQVSPQNNVSSVKMERSVGLNVFFGKPGQWFGANDLDGDKTSIFHDLDGSVTGYPDSYIARVDNYLIHHPGCLTVPRWNGVICSGQYAQLYIQARRPENLTLLIARETYSSRPLALRGVNRGAPYQQYQPVVMLQQAYVMQWKGVSPEEVILYPINFDRGNWIQVALCYPQGTTFRIVSDINQRQSGKVHSVEHYTPASSIEAVLENPSKRLFYFDSQSGYLFLHLQASHPRKGHSYCSKLGCERVKILARSVSTTPQACPPNPFPVKSRGIPAKRLWVSQRVGTPCSLCGAQQVAISSEPFREYVRVQVLSLSRANIVNGLKSAFIKVNDEVFLFRKQGLLFVVVDACTGEIKSRRHFEILTVSQASSAINSYIISAVKDRSIVLVCSRDIKDLPRDSGIPAFIKLGSSKPIGLYRKGSFALLGYRGQSKPSWIKIVNRSNGKEAASIQHYVPLRLKEYKCPGQGREYRKDEKLLKGLLQQCLTGAPLCG
ncbi:inactive cell surface hyaluronidase CEMIP2-like isoform X3 [Lepisosteus oculatus]|uniref:inactive cell surface hyaluronidase CEMIP2-like isoform X3 n=1 Tax=Lepisosteus oculatus TaxID=7918 RepID=UPI0037232C4B